MNMKDFRLHFQSKVIVYKNYDVGDRTFIEVNGTREGDLFKLQPEADIAIGDVLQIEGGNVKWKVIDTDDGEIRNGTMMYKVAKVKKFD